MIIFYTVKGNGWFSFVLCATFLVYFFFKRTFARAFARSFVRSIVEFNSVKFFLSLLHIYISQSVAFVSDWFVPMKQSHVATERLYIITSNQEISRVLAQTVQCTQNRTKMDWWQLLSISIRPHNVLSRADLRAYAWVCVCRGNYTTKTQVALQSNSHSHQCENENEMMVVQQQQQHQRISEINRRMHMRRTTRTLAQSIPITCNNNKK